MGLECKPRARVRTTVSHGDNVSSTRVLRSKPTHSGICRRKQLPTGCSHPTSPRIQATTKGAKEHYRVYYDRRDGTRYLPELQPGDQVLIKRDYEKQWRRRGGLVKQCMEPRSYLVQTSQGTIRRNRRNLQLVTKAASNQLPVCDM